MNLEEICRKIGADSLGYISIEGLKRACAGGKLSFLHGPVLQVMVKIFESKKQDLEEK